MIRVPEAFQVQPFYAKELISLPEVTNSSFREICRAIPFYFDLNPSQKYWDQKHDIIPVLLEWWTEEERTLTALFHERNTKEAKPIMVIMSAAFIDCLFWMNDKPVTGLTHLKQALIDIGFKPINCEERLDFVLQNSSQYHAFTQLRALFLEVKKIYAKIKLIEHKD